jgi:methionyl aminopeptidase
MGLATKTPEQVRAMRRAGLVVASTLDALRRAIAPGVTPAELDALAAALIGDAGATPSFLGYHGYPATICTSVNDVVVHGIPDDRPLRDGDIISIDCGAIVQGWHGDAAITVGVGDLDDRVAALVSACEEALAAGIAAMTTGARLGDIGAAVEASVEASGPYGILTDFTGHGIGQSMHEAPFVPNYRTRRRGPRLEPGVVLAVEPMITLGSPLVSVEADGWTVRTDDGSVSAHVEHTIAVTPDGPWVLTALDSPEPNSPEPGRRGQDVA